MAMQAREAEREQKVMAAQQLLEAVQTTDEYARTHPLYLSVGEWKLVLAATPAVYDYGYRASRNNEHANIERFSHVIAWVQCFTDPFTRSVQQLGGSVLFGDRPLLMHSDVTRKFREMALELSNMASRHGSDKKDFESFQNLIREWMAKHKSALDPIRKATASEPSQTVAFRGIASALLAMDGLIDTDEKAREGKIRAAVRRYVGDGAKFAGELQYLDIRQTTVFPTRNWLTNAQEAAEEVKRKEEEEEERGEAEGEEEEEEDPAVLEIRRQAAEIVARDKAKNALLS